MCHDHDLLPTAADATPSAAIVTCGDCVLRTVLKTQCKVFGGILPLAKENISWMTGDINMNVVKFHSSRKDVYGAQFSYLHHSDVVLDTSTRIYVPTKSTTSTLMINCDEQQTVTFKCHSIFINVLRQ